MNLDVAKTSRSVYTFWTVIGDVGALHGVLFSLCAYFTSIFAFQKPTNSLVSQLYCILHPETLDPNVEQRRTRLNSERQSGLKECLLSCLTKPCLEFFCIRRRKNDIYFERARELLSDEMDIV